MTSYAERIFQLAVDELGDQQRAVSEARTRVPALVAAGAIVPSLVTRAIFAGPHPTGVLEVGFTVLGAGAGMVLLGATLAILFPVNLGFSVNAPSAYNELRSRDIHEQPTVDLTLAAALHARHEANQPVVQRLTGLLRVAIIALAVETVGLAAAAALAS